MPDRPAPSVPPVPDGPRERANYLPVSASTLLNNACIPIVEAFDTHPYLVGSVHTRPDYRDVDVRLILPDGDYDALFANRKAFWSLVCLSVTEYLSRASGLPVDFQIQRMTDANEQYSGCRRDALGFSGFSYGGGLHA